jgi:hypothetical protein
MANEPAQSLAVGSTTAVSGRGPAACPRSPYRLAFADRSPRPGLSSYAAWVHHFQSLPARLGQYATLRPGTERR